MATQGLLHVARVGYPQGQRVHTLCGLWTTLSAGNFVGGDVSRRVKQLCPACRRKWNGGN